MMSGNKRILNVAIFICLQLLSLELHQVVAQPYPYKDLRFGRIRGRYTTLKVNEENRRISEWLGIPYAQTPARFEDTKPWVENWPGVRDASQFGLSCYHDDDNTYGGFGGAQMWNSPVEKGEDCLTLNIWTPDDQATSGAAEPLAVLVWIFGGSFYSGNTALQMYNGKYLAASGGLIVVSINYRLGPLGFFPPFAGDENISGNAGVQDQQTALKWVRDNIGAFGGDPNKVTLMGESAGSVSTSLHMVSPGSRGLFNRVIQQSGNMLTPWASNPLETTMKRARKLVENLNCVKETDTESLDCLRAVSMEEIFGASWSVNDAVVFDFPFIPTVGTKTFPKDLKEETLRGNVENVDILSGYNTNEGSYFLVYSIPELATKECVLQGQCEFNQTQYESAIKLLGLRTNELGEQAAKMMYMDWLYPNNEMQYKDAMDQIISDFHIICPTIRLAKLQSDCRNVFLYHFDYRISSNPWPEWLGVMHGYEIELAFGVPLYTNSHFTEPYNDKDKEVAKRMVKYWTNFAKYGNPNGMEGEADADSTVWPRYSEPTQRYLKIQGDGDSVGKPDKERAFRCSLWENYIPLLQQQTVAVDSMEVKWKNEFSRWMKSMDSWDRAFKNFKDGKRFCT